MIFLPRANFPTHFSVVSTNVRPPQVNQVLLDFVQFTGLIILLQLCALLVANAFTCNLPTILYPGQGSVQSYHYTISCGAEMGLVVNHIIRINQYIQCLAIQLSGISFFFYVAIIYQHTMLLYRHPRIISFRCSKIFNNDIQCFFSNVHCKMVQILLYSLYLMMSTKGALNAHTFMEIVL